MSLELSTVKDSNESIVAVVFDWAGTMIDFGSHAPIRGLQSVFEQRGIPVAAAEARADMGLAKPDHIRRILALPRIHELWEKTYGRTANDDDVAQLTAEFERAIADVLADYAVPITGAVETLSALRERGIQCGSTTGYSEELMRIIVPAAQAHGLRLDAILTASDVKRGRPSPWMCYLNAIRMEVSPLWRMVKVGDTCVDIEEGKNAGMWSVGVIRGSSELGFSEQEIETMDTKELASKENLVRERFLRAGADYVVERIGDVPGVIEKIEARLRQGDRPNG